ncbi:hypothetical protein NVI2019_NGLDDFDA_03894 (plasmid) [Providencia alcalifaciens]|nr:hypothetical protein NVI2019_NGLDDFDA_03894 [Providencia alcalifaciens]
MGPYINFNREYSSVNYPILQITHRIEYMTNFFILNIGLTFSFMFEAVDLPYLNATESL